MAIFDPATDLTSNEMYRDALIRRQIYLSRYSAGLTQELIGLLDQTEADVRNQIERRLASLSGRDFSAAVNSRLNVLAQSIAQIRGEAFDSAGNIWSTDMQGLAQSEANYLDTQLHQVSPVQLDTIMPDALKLAAIVSTQPMQGHVLSDWASKIQDDDVRRIMGAVRVGMAQGGDSEDIIRRVLGTGALNGADGAVEQTRHGVASVTRTAVATVAGEARQAYYGANSDIFDTELFVATLDSHTTEECMALDGDQFPVGDGPQPPLHFNCRSTRVATIDGKAIGDRPATTATEAELDGLEPEERAARVAEMTGQVPASTTYQEWLSGQTPEFQDEVLGPARGDLFRDGMPLKGFVDANYNTLTLDQLNGIAPGELFVSPSVTDKTFDEAVAALDSGRQEEVVALNARVDDLFGFDATNANVIGAWADGAENSTLTHIAAGEDWDSLKAAANMKGLMTDQKQVLLFQATGKGDDFLGTFEVKGDVKDIHEGLLEKGLTNHTLEQLDDGNVRVYAFGQSQADLEKLNQVGESYGEKVSVRLGKGEFLGTTVSQGTDAEIRADAIAQYQKSLEPFLAKQSDDFNRDWRSIYYDWNSNQTGRAGIKAVGDKEAKATTQTWVTASPIRTVDDLYTDADKLKASLDTFAKGIEERTGATWKSPGVKKRPRVLEKIAGGKTPAQISDIVRGTFIVDSPEQAEAVVRELATKYPVIDETWRITNVGYFDRPVKILMPNGQIGEVLIVPPQLSFAKSAEGGGHALYVAFRKIKDAESPEARLLAHKMLDLYKVARDALPDRWGTAFQEGMSGYQDMVKYKDSVETGLRETAIEEGKKAVADTVDAIAEASSEKPIEERVADVIARSPPGTAEAIAEVEAKLEGGIPTDASVAKGGFKMEDGTYTPERQALHDSIVDKIMTDDAVAAATPEDGEAPVYSVLGGRGGSGKGWFTGKNGPVDATKSIYINADDIQDLLPGYEGWNAALYHEEASDIALQIDDLARQNGLNVIYDATLRSTKTITGLVNKYEEAGYDINGYFMSTTPEESATRAMGRFMKSGRFVPPEYILESVSNEKTFNGLVDKFKEWGMWDNNASAPRFIAGTVQDAKVTVEEAKAAETKRKSILEALDKFKDVKDIHEKALELAGASGPANN